MLKKSLLTTLFIALVGIITAQTLQFEWEGNVYQDGQTIISEYNELMMEYAQELKIRNLTGNDMGVIVEREILENADGTLVYFCWGLCLSPENNIGGPVDVTAQSLSDETFSSHVIFSEGETGVVKVRYSAYDRGNPDDRVSIIILAGASANVNEHSLNFGQAYPNPANTQVSFDLKNDSSSDIQAVVYNLLGQEVKSLLVSGLQSRVTIAVDDLEAGIYFCRFTANGEVLKTEKFIVKH